MTKNKVLLVSLVLMWGLGFIHGLRSAQIEISKIKTECKNE